MTRTTLIFTLSACTGAADKAPAELSPTPTDSGAEVEETGAPAPQDTDTAVESVPDGCAEQVWPDIRINELLAANLSGLADGSGETNDWIELANRDVSSVDLAGYSLENADGDTWAFATPELGAGQLLLVYASGQDRQGDPALGVEIHTSFKLDPQSPALILRAPDGCALDRADAGRLYGDVSYGRAQDDGALEYFLEPTPGEENTTESRPAFAEPPTLSPEPGFYADAVEVAISSTEAGATLRYTQDGSEPGEEDSAYTAPFVVDASAQPAVVRARSWVDGLWPSRVSSATYSQDLSILESGMYTVSLIVEPEQLWDEEIGIYTFGLPDYEPWYPYFGANFWEDWEYPVRVQVWDAAGERVIDQEAGIRIHGGYTRAFDQKSLRLYARSAYGPGSFEGQLFETEELDEFQTLVLQIGMDWCSTHLQEVTLPTLLRDEDGRLWPGVDAGAWEPAQVWLNGEYWGYYNLRERTDSDWIEAHHGYAEDEVDRVELGWTHDANWELEQGSWDNFYALNDFVDGADLSDPDTWTTFDGMVDLDSLAAAIVAEAWIGNTDWWYNNLRLWRPREEGGQWRWIIYDFGHGFTSMDYDQIAYSVTWSGDGLPIADALENEAFRVILANTASDLLNTSLSGEHARDTFSTMADRVEPAMAAQFERWCTAPAASWYGAVSYARTFALLREDLLRDDVKSALDLDGTADLDLSSDPEGAGRFELTAVTVAAPFSGVFYTGVPVSITAIPEPGYRFIGWDEAELGEEAAVTVTLDGDASLTARFEAD